MYISGRNLSSDSCWKAAKAFCWVFSGNWTVGFPRPWVFQMCSQAVEVGMFQA